MEMKSFSPSWFSDSIASKTTGLCHVSALFVVKQTLFHLAGGIFKFLHRKNHFLPFIRDASYEIWVKKFPRFPGTFKQRVVTLTLTEYFGFFCCLGYVREHN